MVFTESFFFSFKDSFRLPINGISMCSTLTYGFSLGVGIYFCSRGNQPTNQPSVIVLYRDSIKLAVETITFHLRIFRH